MQTQPINNKLQFLKLGGSLITEKSRPHTVRAGVLARLAEEISTVLNEKPDMQLLLGHGSGSFGHVPAKEYGTRQGVKTKSEWYGFIEVWREAADLNHHVINALNDAGLQAISLAPSASVIAHDGEIVIWELSVLTSALEVGLLPVIYGDVAFDRFRGGTILSTEDLFTYLAHQLMPSRIILAGREPGIWADYPESKNLLSDLSPKNIAQINPFLDGSSNTDVTGGMESKVRQSLELVQKIPSLEVLILSGETPGLLRRALLGERLGTTIHN